MMGSTRSIAMNTTIAQPAHPLPNSDLNAKSATPQTVASPNRFRDDVPRRMPPSVDWTAVKVLTLDEMCGRYIQWMLTRCGGNRAAAAQFLGIGRTTLFRYLKKLDRAKRDSAASNQLRDPHFHSLQEPSLPPQFEPSGDSCGCEKSTE
jgi:DNA-binding NtrC family response regulator